MDELIKATVDELYMLYSRFVVAIVLFLLTIKVVVFLYNLCVGHGFAFITSGKFGIKRTIAYHNPDDKE